jgi:hypothetical protein
MVTYVSERMRTFLLFGVFAGVMAAQSLTTDPPPILQIIRKPGTNGASTRPYADARAQVNVIGMRSITGLPETWLVEAHYSFSSVEDMAQRMAAVAPVRVTAEGTESLQDDVLAPARTMIALYRPNLSYRPSEAVRLLAKSRYFQVSVFRIRPGTEAEFGDVVRLRRATADAVNLERPDLGFQVMSGAPAGTFVFLSPIVTLRNMDEGVNPVPVYAEGLANARRTEGKQAAAEVEISREHLLFRVEPRISYVADDFAQVDPEFWRGKR